MADTVNIVLNFVGNTAIFNTIKQDIDVIQNKTAGLSASLKSILDFGMGFKGVVDSIKEIKGVLDEFTDANRAEQEAQAKLAQVMRNTMGASAAEVQSIKDLAAAQVRLSPYWITESTPKCRASKTSQPHSSSSAS